MQEGSVGATRSRLEVTSRGLEQAPQVRFSRGLVAGRMAPTANADLLHLLAQSKVAEEIQKTLFESGVTGVKEFSAMFEDEKDLRAILKKDFNLDPESGGLKARVSISKVVIAWETAKGRTAKLVEMEGEAEQRSEAKRLPVPDHTAMKQAFEDSHWRIKDHDTPAPRWMEKRFDQLEKNVFRAEPLSEVLGVNEEDDTLATPKVDKGGSIVTVRVGNRIPLPENTETLRHRLDLWGRSWLFAGSMHTNRIILKDLTPMDFTHYINHLLGPPCYGTSDGRAPRHPGTGGVVVETA